MTDEAVVLEEQLDTDDYPTRVDRHLVIDLKTGWYTVFDPIRPPVPTEALRAP